jgi:hypothetical protein
MRLLLIRASLSLIAINIWSLRDQGTSYLSTTHYYPPTENPEVISADSIAEDSTAVILAEPKTAERLLPHDSNDV